MATDDALHTYYGLEKERDRLATGMGLLEFERTTEIVLRTLPPAPAVIADIGGGPGRYTDWLVDRGYAVHHRDVIPHHVAQVRDRHPDGDQVDTAVGDAQALDLGDQSVDAMLLLGPLYHLIDAAARATAIAEVVRVVRPGGMVFAAAISRWSPRVAGSIIDAAYKLFPNALGLIDEVESTGVLPPLVVGGFTGYVHTPVELRSELSTQGLEFHTVLPVEGPACALDDTEISARLTDAGDRNVLLNSLRALEEVPGLLGMTSHLLAVAQRV